MIRPSAILFDLDGTLIDSYPAIAASVNHVRQGRGLPALTVAEVTRHVGRGAHYLLRHTVGETDIEGSLLSYRQHHPTVIHRLTEFLPEASETLHELHRRGYHLGICSNKPVDFTRELIQHLGLKELLSAVLGPEDVERPKPAPDMLLAAMQRLNASPEGSLYVGDMVVDIETARGAGVPVWVVATGSNTAEDLDAAKPDRRLGSLGEILRLLP